MNSRRVIITLGDVGLEAELLATPTADRLLMALPIFSKVEPWGEAWHFETHVRTGRERGARLNAVLGEIYYWSDDDRIIIPYGPTPISRPGEIRLPRPCNVIGTVLGDVSVLRRVRPTEKVSIEACQVARADKGNR